MKKYVRNKGHKCSVENCDRLAFCKRLCAAHWHRHYHKSHLDDLIPIGTLIVGPTHPNWKTGIHTSLDGRKLVRAFSNHTTCPYRLRYRFIMEGHLGRRLNSNEIVHHKNGKTDDDRIENLEIMTRSEHMKLHWRLKKNAQNNI